MVAWRKEEQKHGKSGQVYCGCIRGNIRETETFKGGTH